MAHAIATIRSLAPSCYLRDDELEQIVLSEALRLDRTVEFDRVEAA
jgi:hypothetical protein